MNAVELFKAGIAGKLTKLVLSEDGMFLAGPVQVRQGKKAAEDGSRWKGFIGDAEGRTLIITDRDAADNSYAVVLIVSPEEAGDRNNPTWGYTNVDFGPTQTTRKTWSSDREMFEAKAKEHNIDLS